MRILAVDPAIRKPQAYSIWVDEKLQDWGEVELEQFLSWIGRTRPCPDWVFCEGQYSGVNARDTIRLARISGRIEQKARDVAAAFVVLNPLDWQRRIFGRKARPIRAVGRTGRAQAIARGFIVEARLVTREHISPDCVEAILVGAAAVGCVHGCSVTGKALVVCGAGARPTSRGGAPCQTQRISPKRST